MNIIYCYTNKITGSKYIGQTINPESRYNQHKSNAYNPGSTEYNSTFHKKVREYGWDNFIYEVLEQVDDIKQLDEAEKKWIAFYNPYQAGYNDTRGGQGNPGTKSEETKKKLSLAQGALTEEEIIAIRKAYTNHESPTEYYNQYYKDKMHFNSFLNIWTGKKYSTIMPEVIEKGRHNKLNQELADQIRKEYLTGRETYQSLADKYQIGKCTVRDVLKGRTWNKENNNQSIEPNKNTLKVQCIETNQIFNSVIEAAKSIGRTQSALSKHLNGVTQSCGKDENGNKLHWQIINN